MGDCDPMDSLDDVITPAQASGMTSIEDDDFQRALADLAGSFQGKEEQGDPLSEKLANILNSSLRRRPSDDKVKATAAKILLPSNVGNLKVPVTNNDITMALSAGETFLDARLTRANCIISKAMVPLAKIVSDIGEKKNLRSEVYFSSLNDSLRLLAAAFNYINHIRKEVARIHVNDSALAQLCKWECEVGTDKLFPSMWQKSVTKFTKLRSWAGLPSNHKCIGMSQIGGSDHVVIGDYRHLDRNNRPGKTQPPMAGLFSARDAHKGGLYNEGNFKGGKLYNHIDNWMSLTGDRTIYNIVIGKIIEFDGISFQDNKPRALVLSSSIFI